MVRVAVPWPPVTRATPREPSLNHGRRRAAGYVVAKVLKIGALYGGDFELAKQRNDMALHAALIGGDGAGLLRKPAASEDAALLRCLDILLA